MAQKTETIVHLIDDLDGGKAAATVPFAVDGAEYEIDLSAKNQRAMIKALRPYLDAARTVKPAKRKPAKRRGTIDTKAVRAWAAENGVEVNDRGRVPAAVVEQYQAANA